MNITHEQIVADLVAYTKYLDDYRFELFISSCKNIFKPETFFEMFGYAIIVQNDGSYKIVDKEPES